MGKLLSDEQLDKLPSIEGYPPTITCLTEFFRNAKRQVAQAQLDLDEGRFDEEREEIRQEERERIVDWLGKHLISVKTDLEKPFGKRCLYNALLDLKTKPLQEKEG